MAPPKKLPSTEQLVKWVEKGWTHQRIADYIFETTGEHVSRASISAALSRAGKTADKPRYDDEIPWRVKQSHLKEYPARMLRLLGKRRSGQDLTDNEQQRLDSWLNQLEINNAVVGYDPDNAIQGFHYIDPKPGDGADGIPIHRQRIWTIPPALRQQI